MSIRPMPRQVSDPWGHSPLTPFVRPSVRLSLSHGVPNRSSPPTKLARSCQRETDGRRRFNFPRLTRVSVDQQSAPIIIIIIIIYYATRAAHTHTQQTHTHNHVHQHTQNYILRSIKKHRKRLKMNFMLKTCPYCIFHHTFTVLYCIQSVFGC